MEFIKAKIDSINLNIKVEEDFSVIRSKAKYEIIEIYPTLCEIFKTLDIPFEKFKLRNNSVASRFRLNHEGIYLEFKTLPPRTGEASDNSKKICQLQLKGEWFLKNGYNLFCETFKNLPQSTISKIEISFDFIENEYFLKETMDLFLNHRKHISKLEGDNRIYFHFNQAKEFGLTYSNISKELKIYNKFEELKGNKKQNLYYLKNPDFINNLHYRIELGFSRTAYIERNLNLASLLSNNISEKEVISIFLKSFLKNFSISKKSKIKAILKELKNSNFFVEV